MTTLLNVPAPSSEEIISALTISGENPTTERIDAVKVRTDAMTWFEGDRDSEVRRGVARAVREIAQIEAHVARDALLAARAGDAPRIKILAEIEHTVTSEIPAWDAFYTLLPGDYPITVRERQPGFPFAVAEVDVRVINDSKPSLLGGVAVSTGATGNNGKQIKLDVSVLALRYSTKVEISGVTWQPYPDRWSNYQKPAVSDAPQPLAHADANATLTLD